MSEREKEEIKPGDIVQIVDERLGLVGAFVLVDEVKSFGIQGFIFNVVSFEESNQIWLRLNWGQIERVGRATIVPFDPESDGAETTQL